MPNAQKCLMDNEGEINLFISDEFPMIDHKSMEQAADNNENEDYA